MPSHPKQTPAFTCGFPMFGTGIVHHYPPAGGQSGLVIPFAHALRFATGHAASHDATLATCQQYSLPLPARDFHPIVNAHGGRTRSLAMACLAIPYKPNQSTRYKLPGRGSIPRNPSPCQIIYRPLYAVFLSE